MLARVQSAQVSGLKADIILVEVDLSRGLHSFSVVGLPDKAVEEARDRINAAIKNSGFKSPQKGNRRITVALAPADLKKEGSFFDLAIALGYLLAAEDIKFDHRHKLFLGELGLDGELRPIRGTLLLASKAKEAGFTEIYLPKMNAAEAALVSGIKVFGCSSLKELINHLSPRKNENGQPEETPIVCTPTTKITQRQTKVKIDFADIKGQPTAKRGLEIAAAGGHNVAMYGPPGTGKTMLARAFAGIFPELSEEEIIEITGIHSAAGTLEHSPLTEPPFRSPHHTSSYVSIVGGGTTPKPGEITLAHRGILFLDEFPEFDKSVLEALRQPLEDKIISVARAKGTMHFPASVILVAAMNPCPCGNQGLREKECICSQAALQRYSRRLSGPIMDRIDIWLNVSQVDPKKLLDNKYQEEPSLVIKRRVDEARQRQRQRFLRAGIKLSSNAEMSNREIAAFAPLSVECTELLNASAQRLDLSARAYHRIIKLARTIADLATEENIKTEHLLEALQYRPKINGR